MDRGEEGELTTRIGILTPFAMVLAVPQGSSGIPNKFSASGVFEQLKGLVGEWRGQRPDGRPVVVAYRLTAGGSALVETWNLGPGRESITIYHLDGGQLLASHFCPQGNQPRLKLWRVAGTRFDFTFFDATGVQPGQGVQHDFWIDLAADGTITRSETYVQGDTTETEKITYRRWRSRKRR